MKENRLLLRKALVTAGPTYEELDPVRFIGNYSTGKMGFAIAETLAQMGVDVVLVSGPSEQKISYPSVNVIKVTTAEQMYETCEEHFLSCDLVIFAAAVADYKPVSRANDKIKKSDKITLELEKTVDIAATLGAYKREDQIVGGFALETENEKVNAIKKLIRKNFYFIVLNSMKDEGAGFGHDTNKITIFKRDGAIKDFELKTKKMAALDIICEAFELLREKQSEKSHLLR
jgi:phosphopantothenoylcysteine decarboxylase / phosphopantothenate---cysteine ligase